MASGFDVYDEYKKKKGQQSTIKIPQAPVVKQDPIVSYAKNITPARNASGYTAPKLSNRQFGIGMQQTQAQPLPYAKKVAQTLPRVEPQVLQKAQQIGRQAQGKTQEQIRQQNLANIKRVGDEAAYDTTEKLQNLFEKPVKPKSVLGANAWAGLGQFNKGLAQTADFILPDVITPKAVQQGLDYYKKTEDAQAQHAANVNKEQGVSDTVGGLIQGTVAAIPNAILAMISGGTSLGAQTIGQTSTGFIGSVGNAVKELAKNPMFYSSLAQTAGSEYEQAKANGATELEATISAIISSIVNSGIEIGGGIEAIAKNPISLKNWVKGMLDEGKEEVLQGIISQAAAKATYDKDKQWVSATDENAVINPGRMAQEFAGGAVVGGILGGGQMLAGKALGMPTEQDSYLPKRGENATAADLAGRLDINDPQPGKLPTVTRREQRALDAISAKTGVNIQIDDDIKGSNGYFDRSTNTLHISRNSNNAVYQVAAHEIAHFIESNPTEWRQLYEIANANLSEDARSKLEYVLQKTGYTDAEMKSEVVSHYVQQCVTDINSFEQLVGVNRTLAQRIVDAFDSFVRKITMQRSVGNDSDTQYLREIMGDITPEQAQQTLAQMKKALAAGGQATGEGVLASKKLPNNGVDTNDTDYYHHKWAGEFLSNKEMAAFMTKVSMHDGGLGYITPTGYGGYVVEVGENPQQHDRLVFTDGDRFPSIDKVVHINGAGEEIQDRLEAIVYGCSISTTEESVDRLLSFFEEEGLAYCYQRPSRGGINRDGGDHRELSEVHRNDNGVQNRGRSGKYSEFYSLKLTDSDGNQLTKDQAEYFKDSKVRDENGNLKVMYHGTPNGDFTIFKEGSYFTDNKSYAETYQNPGASSISTGKIANAPKTFAVYLDIKKPFDINEAEARSIYINDYIKGGNSMGINPYLPDVEYAKIQTIDWTEGEDLRDFLVENGYDYDGLVLDEGATGGYGDEVQSRGKSYVVFTPEQIKSVSNENPTSDADIRYSRKLNREALQEMAERTRAGIPYAPGYVPKQQLPRAEQTQPQQLPYAPGYNAANSPVQPTLPRAEELNSERQKNAQKPNLPYDATLPTAGEVNARQQEDFESFWFGHPELSEQDAMRLYEEQQRKSQAEKPVSPVSSDSGKMPQRERRQAWNYADKVKNEFDLDIDDKSLRGDIESLFSDVRKNGWTAENEARLQELSKRMVEKSNGVLNEAESRPARDAKRFIRGTKLYITPSIKAEIEHNHGNYNAFRKKHMGKLDMKLVDSEAHPGQSIDSYYTELSDIAPEWFPAKDADMNDKDMLEQIIWFVDEDTDVYDHPFEADPEGAAEFIAGRIKEGYTDLFTNQDVDIEKAKQAFAMEVNAKKALEATEKKAALSSDEKEIVSAMVKGQINPDSVTDQRIRSVYEARVENYAAQRDSRAARRNLRSRYKELAQDFAEYASGWKDKVRGWFFDMETAERNIRDVIPDKELAERFIEQYITPLHTNEAEANRLKNELRDRLKKLNLGTKAVHRITPEGGKSGLYSESAIVQMYGEGLVNEQQVKMSGADVDKVKNAVSEFRKVYDQLLDMANEVLVANGYAPVEKRANYFPHWQEPEPTGVRKFLAKMGMKILGDDLPTDIAGITDTFRPGKKFVANYLRRQGNQTEYDALKGFDIYIDSVADVIFHTDDIQRLRALETEIRYQASDTGVQSRVRDIMEDPYLDEDAKSEAVRKILEEDRTSLSHFVNWLRKYTDTLAGKKNFSDRDWEYKVGRDLYETMKAVEGRIAANMVGGNISSAMTNFIPIFQGAGEVKAKYMAQAMKDVARSAIKYDGFADRSDFLTNRLGSDKLMKTGLEKATSAASKPFEIVDRFTSETLTRAKYMQNVDAGMDVDAAMADADAWAASLMADRSKGAVPLVFTEKNPVTKAFTMFQLEVNNQFRYMMKDLPRNMQDQGKAAIVGALMKMFIATGLYGELFKGLAGYDPTFNPLSLLRELIEGLSDDEKKKSEVVTDFAVDAAKEIPFVGNVLGGGRLPVSNVGDGIKETANAFLKYGTGEQTGKAFLNTLGNSAGSTAAMLLLPMGGNQLKKTAQGLTAVARGKVTTTDNEGNEKIKYLVDQTPGNAMRGALFGQWSFPEAREYVEGGFKMTNAKASDVINRSEAESGIPAKTAMSVYKSMAGLGTKAYKLDKIFSDETLTPNQMAWLERELLNDGKPGMADQAIAAGVSPKIFYDVVTGANQDNKGGTSQTETLKELVRRNDLTNNQKGDIYYQMASDSQQGKMNKAKQNGISHAQWYQYMVKADSNRNGSVTRDKAKAALDSMNLSLEKKAYIWKLEGWSDKTNPYNK